MNLEALGGWIYVLMTSSDYNRFKIGRTRRNPLDRAKEVRIGDPGVGLLAAYFVPVSVGALSRVETAIHAEFGGRIAFHDESLSEWFPGSPNLACEWIEAVFEDWQHGRVSSMSSGGGDRICRAYEADLEMFYGGLFDAPDGLPM